MNNFLRYIFNWSQLPIINRRSDLCRKMGILINYGICDYYEETLNLIKESEFLENSLLITFIVIFFTFVLWIFYDYLHNEQTDNDMLNDIDEKIIETNATNMQLIDTFLLIRKSEENNLKFNSNNNDSNEFKIDNHLKLERFNEIFTDVGSSVTTTSRTSNLFPHITANVSGDDLLNCNYDIDSTTTVASTNTDIDSENSCHTNPSSLNQCINNEKTFNSDEENQEKLFNDAKFLNNIFNLNKKMTSNSNADLELRQKCNINKDKLIIKGSDTNEKFIDNILYSKIDGNNKDLSKKNPYELLTKIVTKLNKDTVDGVIVGGGKTKTSTIVNKSKDISASNSSVTSSPTPATTPTSTATPRTGKSPHMKRLMERQRLNQLKETDNVVAATQSIRKIKNPSDGRLQIHGDPRRDLPTKPISSNASDIKRGIFEKRRQTSIDKMEKQQNPPTVNPPPVATLPSAIKKVTKFIEKKSPNLSDGTTEYQLETSVLMLPGTNILNTQINNTINNIKTTSASITNLKLNKNLSMSSAANVNTILQQQHEIEEQIHTIYNNNNKSILEPSGLDLSKKPIDNIFEDFFAHN